AARLIINHTRCLLNAHDFRGARADDRRHPLASRAATFNVDALGDSERFVVNTRRNQGPMTGRCEVNCTLNCRESVAGHLQRLWSRPLLCPDGHWRPKPNHCRDEEEDVFLHRDSFVFWSVMSHGYLHIYTSLVGYGGGIGSGGWG